MDKALHQAEVALINNEVPIGCVIVKDSKIISYGRNSKETKNNSLMHAEIIAIQKAQKKLNTWHLDGCSLYSTLEPCLMCSGAIIQSRISEVYFGASDPKSIGLTQIVKDYYSNIDIKIYGGVKENESTELLKTFFKKLRDK